MQAERNGQEKRRTPNGVMAAVAPQKRQWENESLYPAGTTVEAATTPSRWDVRGKGGSGSALFKKNKV